MAEQIRDLKQREADLIEQIEMLRKVTVQSLVDDGNTDMVRIERAAKDAHRSLTERRAELDQVRALMKVELVS